MDNTILTFFILSIICFVYWLCMPIKTNLNPNALFGLGAFLFLLSLILFISNSILHLFTGG